MESFITVTEITNGKKVQLTKKKLDSIEPHPTGTTVINTKNSGSFMVREDFDVVEKMIDTKLM